MGKKGKTTQIWVNFFCDILNSAYIELKVWVDLSVRVAAKTKKTSNKNPTKETFIFELELERRVVAAGRAADSSDVDDGGAPLADPSPNPSNTRERTQPHHHRHRSHRSG